MVDYTGAQVELDEKSPFERLQLLNEVFAAMDPVQQVDLREESHEARLERVYAFLSMLKYPKLPTDEGIELFSEGTAVTVAVCWSKIQRTDQ